MCSRDRSRPRRRDDDGNGTDPWGFHVFAGVATLALAPVLIVARPRDFVDEEIAEYEPIVAHQP